MSEPINNPSPSSGNGQRRQPVSLSIAIVASVAGCSPSGATIHPGVAPHSPRSARLIDSVPPLVKITSDGLAPSIAASRSRADSSPCRAPRPAACRLPGLPKQSRETREPPQSPPPASAWWRCGRGRRVADSCVCGGVETQAVHNHSVSSGNGAEGKREESRQSCNVGTATRHHCVLSRWGLRVLIGRKEVHRGGRRGPQSSRIGNHVGSILTGQRRAATRRPVKLAAPYVTQPFTASVRRWQLTTPFVPHGRATRPAELVEGHGLGGEEGDSPQRTQRAAEMNNSE